MSSDRYEIQKKIGEGGAGSVYLAVDTRLDREVAIKRLMSEEDGKWTQSTVDMMLKEARLLSSIDHPNIVTIYDADVDQDGPYVVMELLQGRNMDELIAENPMTAADFKAFATHCLDALTAAHSINVIHRDIKPNNIVLKWLPNGKFQAKLLDFGMAKLSQVPTKQTVDHGGSVMGSIYFMAPEQFERIELDARTDIYALGAVFYYTLTGAYPFSGETAAEVMAAHLTHRVQPIAELRPDLPEWVCNWIMWLINREMQHRPESAQVALDYFQANDDEIPLRSDSSGKNIEKSTGVIQVGQISTATLAPQQPDTQASIAKPTLLTASGSLSKASNINVSVPQENITKPQDIKATASTPPSKLNTSSSPGVKLITGEQPVAKQTSPNATTATGANTSPNGVKLVTGAQPALSKSDTLPEKGKMASKSANNKATTKDAASKQKEQVKEEKPPKKKTNFIPLIIISILAILAGLWIAFTQLSKNKVIGQYNALITQADGDSPEPAVTSKPDLEFLLEKLYGANTKFDSGAILRRLLIAESDGTYDLGDEIATFATQEGTLISDQIRSSLFNTIPNKKSELSVTTLINYIKSSENSELVVDAIRASKGGATFAHLDFFTNLILKTRIAKARQAAEHVAGHIIKNTKQRATVSKVITNAIANADNNVTKASITRLIGSLGGEEASVIITNALNSGNPDAVIPALGAIKEWKDDTMLNATIDFWNTSPDEKVRKTAFETLYSLMTRFHIKQSSNKTQGLWENIADSTQSRNEKLLVINAMATGNKPYSKAIIEQFSNDSDQTVSKRALKALEYLDGKNENNDETEEEK